jgi:hypothetical protein
MRGSLNGCWQTHIDTARTTAGGAYLESGEELFVGRLNGGEPLTTTCKFEAKLNPDGSEIRGRCQHQIVTGAEPAASRVLPDGSIQRHHRSDDHYARLPRSHPPRVAASQSCKRGRHFHGLALACGPRAQNFLRSSALDAAAGRRTQYASLTEGGCCEDFASAPGPCADALIRKGQRRWQSGLARP